ncbi:unnamed protein product, partial [Effrenium voratum]
HHRARVHGDPRVDHAGLHCHGGRGGGGYGEGGVNHPCGAADGRGLHGSGGGRLLHRPLRGVQRKPFSVPAVSGDRALERRLWLRIGEGGGDEERGGRPGDHGGRLGLRSAQQPGVAGAGGVWACLPAAQ